MSPPCGYYVVAHPKLSARDREWIEEIRSDHDPNAARIAAHFTLAFALTGLTAQQVCEHLNAFATSERSIPFTCRHVMVGHDHANPIYSSFLVPDEGFSAINLLRMRLHTGRLSDQLNPGIPFIPHITLGSGDDADAVQKRCQMLNAQQPCVQGIINSLTLVEAAEDNLTEIDSFPLLPPIP